MQLEHLYLNAKVTVFSRQLEVVAYADEFTQRHLSSQQEKYVQNVTHGAQ